MKNTLTEMKDDKNFQQALSAFIRFLTGRFREDRCFQVAGSLTFTSLLSLIPILTIALAMISAFPVFSGFTDLIKHFIIANLVPDSSSRLISLYLQQFSTNAAKLTAFGIFFLALTALVLMLTIDHAFNAIWRVGKKRPLLNSIVTYWGILTIGPLLIGASLTLTSWLMRRSHEIVHTVPFTLKLLPISLTFSALILLYFVVPYRKVKFIHAAVGGMAAGVAFELMKFGFGWYIEHFSTYALVYGAFSSLPIFLLWIFLSWLVVLSGAVLTSSLPYWRQAAWQQKEFPGKRFHEAVKILLALKGFASPGLEELQSATLVGIDRIEEILQLLAKNGWVKETVDGSWLLAQDPEKISLGEVFRQTAFEPEAAEFLPEVFLTLHEQTLALPLSTVYAKTKAP